MNSKIAALLLFVSFGILNFCLGYLLTRDNFTILSIIFLASFGLTWLVYLKYSNLSVSVIIFLSLCMRMVFIGAIPQLSDDYFRYVFDGHLVSNCIGVYQLLPVESVKLLPDEDSNLWAELLEGMNSPKYYSIYPPLHQFFFALATVGSDSTISAIVKLRGILILFDLVNIGLIYRLLTRWGRSPGKVLLYAFNPLVIVEITGNLHFEGIVLTFLLCSIYFLDRSRPKASALFWSLAVSLKLVPLILAPIWLSSWKGRDIYYFILVSLGTCAVLLHPLFRIETIPNFATSFLLFQQSFEFNASIYYLLRWISMYFIDFNPIRFLGPALGIVGAILILILGCKRTENASALYSVRKIVWIYLIFLLMQPVVHPWYIIPMFGISLLTNYWFAFGWTGLVFLSYSAYSSFPVNENSTLILLEYTCLLAIVLRDLKMERQISMPVAQ